MKIESLELKLMTKEATGVYGTFAGLFLKPDSS